AAYEVGKHLFLKASPEEVTDALRWFRAGVEGNAGSARAHAGVAVSLLARWSFGIGTPDELTEAMAEARKSVALDDRIGWANAALGTAYMISDWNFREAERSYHAALDRDPKSTMALFFYSRLLTATGRFEEAKALMERAIEIDPVSPLIRMQAGLI